MHIEIYPRQGKYTRALSLPSSLSRTRSLTPLHQWPLGSCAYCDLLEGRLNIILLQDKRQLTPRGVGGLRGRTQFSCNPSRSFLLFLGCKEFRDRAEHLPPLLLITHLLRQFGPILVTLAGNRTICPKHGPAKQFAFVSHYYDWQHNYFFTNHSHSLRLRLSACSFGLRASGDMAIPSDASGGQPPLLPSTTSSFHLVHRESP